MNGYLQMWNDPNGSMVIVALISGFFVIAIAIAAWMDGL